MANLEELELEENKIKQKIKDGVTAKELHELFAELERIWIKKANF